MTLFQHLRAACIAVLMGIGAAALPITAAQAADRIYTSLFSDVAVGGYDPVTYFTQSKALKGSKKFQTTHEGATWRFTSQETLDLFKADPAAYAPQYGGYCAWAVSQGYTAKGSPKNWAVHDGKLYLNYNDAVQADWNADRDGFITLADGNWPKVLQ